MEKLEQQKKIIDLGKLFVKELKLEPGVDTFSRWMAHYIAEKMSIAETSEGSEKEVAERECFDLILKLWDHRHSLPSGRRPLENFEPLLETLSKLKPERREPYFYLPFNNRDIREIETVDLESKSLEQWLGVIEKVDKTARIWIEFALNKAISYARDKKTKQWIKAASGIRDNPEVKVITSLVVENSLSETDDKKEDFYRKYKSETLKERIDELSNYAELNNLLLNEYQNELDKISKI